MKNQTLGQTGLTWNKLNEGQESKIITEEAMEIDSYVMLNSDHFHCGKIERDMD